MYLLQLPKLFREERQSPAIKVYPYPVRDKANLEFSIPEWSDVDVVLFNSSGQQAGVALRLNHVSGTVLQEIKLSGTLSSGMYYVNCSVRGTGKTVKYNLTSKLLFLGRKQ